VATAEANLNVARSTLEATRANAANQEANLAKARAVSVNDGRNAARLDDLHGRGLISAMDRDNARTNAESSQASLKAAEAQLAAAQSQVETQKSQVMLAQSSVEGAQASLKISQTNLDNTRLLSPFPGHISARNLYPGAAVSSQAAGTANTSIGILVLQDISVVKIPVEVQERHISLVRIGSVARVLVDAYPDRVFQAKATRIVHALDTRSRTLGVEMEVANPGGLLKPGMYARVELVIDHHPRALLVHGEAIFNEGETPVVFVVSPAGVVAKRSITTGVGEGTLVEVTNGLTGDELIIVEGKELVRDGQKVRAELKK
jgi:RND family efflux transporter MFP subunit